MTVGNPNVNDVSGSDIRNMFFHIMPNWNYAVGLSYNFQTVISITRRKLEQRKALIQRPKRILSYSVTDNLKGTSILNYLIYLKARNILTPIYTEPIIPTRSGSLFGLNILPVNDTTYYYNLRSFLTNTTAEDYIVLIDKRGILDVEVLQISLLASAADPATIIRTATPVTQNFMGNTTVIFPLFRCFLTDKNFKNISDTMTKFNLEFTEYFK